MSNIFNRTLIELEKLNKRIEELESENNRLRADNNELNDKVSKSISPILWNSLREQYELLRKKYCEIRDKNEKKEKRKKTKHK